ncbi:hypothetical protein PTNB73_04736 [Pyrenophora teres f. teres]|uniref:Uncharacterized protein n=1 Tax=Pyrenophora teres f. teres TaxID=97479 RepID=A0A6S6W1J6_9PLEO|nr:hypothetical protein HRS9139_05702 [Pyrenophora teres f. teres]KAE8840345.1 hypothetical protein PTNB85_03744 [Pyrenophora teres f. teres]KAE8849515.1 hypothetical protein HRS9122_03531 [Pyrenophora teres f. teres]KAE8863844.1 hypothetical protein PTNB29_03808 [Pyrenophora teres f. teres]KAE8866642.1 hypothetical protein PTNB73_04736 [Pyrenophora teres f. teres]
MKLELLGIVFFAFQVLVQAEIQPRANWQTRCTQPPTCVGGQCKLTVDNVCNRNNNNQLCDNRLGSTCSTGDCAECNTKTRRCGNCWIYCCV